MNACLLWHSHRVCIVNSIDGDECGYCMLSLSYASLCFVQKAAAHAHTTKINIKCASQYLDFGKKTLTLSHAHTIFSNPMGSSRCCWISTLYCLCTASSCQYICAFRLNLKKAMLAIITTALSNRSFVRCYHHRSRHSLNLMPKNTIWNSGEKS